MATRANERVTKAKTALGRSVRRIGNLLLDLRSSHVINAYARRGADFADSFQEATQPVGTDWGRRSA